MALDAACPRKLKKPRKKLKPKFFADEEASRLKENFLRLQHQFETTGELDIKQDAVNAKKSYDQRLKLLRQEASANFIERADDKPKAMWKIVNNARNQNRNSTDDIKLKINGQLSHNPQEVANHLNLFFVNMAETTLQKIPADEKKELESVEPHETALMETMTKTSIKEVKDTIKNLKFKNSAEQLVRSYVLFNHLKKTGIPSKSKMLRMGRGSTGHLAVFTAMKYNLLPMRNLNL
ncbi:hypothetical protein J6590_054714 [Homalodisca vitripennis]|nr:hypothetical protein J6590_054714 [Homalodisca vitripennis]